MNWKEQAAAFMRNVERKEAIIAIGAQTNRVEHLRRLLSTLTSQAATSGSAVDTARDLSGVLIDSLSAATKELAAAYASECPGRNMAQHGELVLVTRERDDAPTHTGIQYYHEMMLAEKVVDPGIVLSVWPLPDSDFDEPFSEDGYSEFVGLLSFDEQTREALSRINGLNTLRWEGLDDAWDYLDARIEGGITFSDGTKPHIPAPKWRHY